MLTIINQAWNWKEFNAIEIIRTNDFGNVLFKTDQNEYWRICPEEISCEKIAVTEAEFHEILAKAEFIEDWEMTKLVNTAISELGALKENEKFCLKIAAVLGGEYEHTNLGKISFSELIAFSGDLGFQIKNLKDGQKIKLNR